MEEQKYLYRFSLNLPEGQQGSRVFGDFLFATQDIEITCSEESWERLKIELAARHGLVTYMAIRFPVVSGEMVK